MTGILTMNLALLLGLNNFSFDLMLYRLPGNARKVDDSQEYIDIASLILLVSKESCFVSLIAFQLLMLMECQLLEHQTAHCLTLIRVERLFEVYFFL